MRNYSRAPELRTLVTLRVAYDTPSERLQAIPKVLEDVVRAQPHARFVALHADLPTHHFDELLADG